MRIFSCFVCLGLQVSFICLSKGGVLSVCPPLSCGLPVQNVITGGIHNLNFCSRP